MPNWGLDDEPTPEQLADRKRLRARALASLDRQRSRLPRLTKAQTEIVVSMLVAAYQAGYDDASLEAGYRETSQAQDAWEAAHLRSQKGVAARRRKSKRLAIIEAFKASKGVDVSIEQLAKDHGVSRATAYRAIGMMAKKKPTSRSST